MKSSDAMRIGDLADRFGLATHVLRHWESLHLLTPARDINGRRRYGPDDLVRVAVILRAKEAGLSLDDIHAVIAADSPASRRQTLEDHRVTLERRIAAAQASLDLISSALNCDHDDFTTCPHFRQTVADRIGVDVPRYRPVLSC
ncbi:MerR family transcriptional regulator [Actinacidiphila soli]|uniref:MerR family transcriptional regulator n=1 Tax=Actinacidiphila soli TaxID=2487275 RepID=UPI000FC9B33A|nr:MerR family transcriptional regulator [Actinacidiphila soli]